MFSKLLKRIHAESAGWIQPPVVFDDSEQNLSQVKERKQWISSFQNLSGRFYTLRGQKSRKPGEPQVLGTFFLLPLGFFGVPGIFDTSPFDKSRRMRVFWKENNELQF